MSSDRTPLAGRARRGIEKAPCHGLEAAEHLWPRVAMGKAGQDKAGGGAGRGLCAVQSPPAFSELRWFEQWQPLQFSRQSLAILGQNRVLHALRLLLRVSHTSLDSPRTAS